MASLLVHVCTGTQRVSTLVASFAGLRADPVADRALLYEAARIRDESHQNRYRKVERLQWQLIVLSLALLFVVAGIFILAATLPIRFGQTQGFGGRILAYVGLFGALGGCLSAIQSLSKGATGLRIPEQLAMGAITFVRPLFGAAAAMAVFAFLESGLLTVQQNTNAAVLATSFVAGFTERFVVHAAGSITKTGSVE